MRVTDLQVNSAADIVKITQLIGAKGVSAEATREYKVSSELEFNTKMGTLISGKFIAEYLDALSVIIEEKNDDSSKYQKAKSLKLSKELINLNNSLYREITNGRRSDLVPVVDDCIRQDIQDFTDFMTIGHEGRKRMRGLMNKIKKEQGIIL